VIRPHDAIVVSLVCGVFAPVHECFPQNRKLPSKENEVRNPKRPGAEEIKGAAGMPGFEVCRKKVIGTRHAVSLLVNYSLPPLKASIAGNACSSFTGKQQA
jgi:hypothetical protein